MDVTRCTSDISEFCERETSESGNLSIRIRDEGRSSGEIICEDWRNSSSESGYYTSIVEVEIGSFSDGSGIESLPCLVSPEVLSRES